MPQFHFKALGYDEMKNSDEKVNIEAFRDAKNAVFIKGEGLITYTWIITEIYHPTLCILSDDDMIYTYGCQRLRPRLKMGVEKSILVGLRIWRTRRHSSSKSF